MNRKLAVGVLAAGLLLTGAGTAFAGATGGNKDIGATASWHKIPTLSISGPAVTAARSTPTTAR